MQNMKKLAPEDYYAWCEIYVTRTKKLLNALKRILQNLARETIPQDLPGILTGAFCTTDHRGKPIPAPTLRRDFLSELGMDPAQCQQLQYLRDADFVPAMESWIRGKSLQQQRQIMEKCLAKLDIQGLSKLFRYTRVNNQLTLLRLAAANLSLTPESFRAALENYSKLRNFDSHLNEVDCQNLEPDQDYANLRALARYLQKSQTPSICEDAARCLADIEKTEAALKLPPLPVSKLEADYGFTPGTLGQKLKENSLFGECLKRDATLLLAVQEEDLKPFLENIRHSEQLAGITPGREAAGTAAVPIVAAEAASRLTLPAYTAGKFNASQLNYFVDHFAILADAGTLLSRDGLALIANVLVPVLAARKKRLQIDWGTLVHIYRTEKEAADASLRETAKLARHQIYHLQHQGFIRYVGCTYCDPNPRESLVQLLLSNREAPSCVITTDRELIARLNTGDTPFALCLGLWGSRGLALRSECAERYANYGWDPLAEAIEEDRGEAESPDTAAEAPSPQTADLRLSKAETAQKRPATSFPEVVPGTHDVVLDEQGRKLMLDKMKGQPGGEGTVYATTRADQVAKIYHANKLNQERLDKLTAMRAIEPGISSVCWPTSLLYNEQHQFVGFLMQAAPADAEELGSSVMKLGGKSVSEKKMPNWNRASIVQCAIQICNTFDRLHRSNILMGDVNPRNIMVSLSDPSQVYFVDCDSYQVGSFNCPVGMAEYSSPKILRRIADTPGGYAVCPRTMEDENYALTTLLFKMLMLGQTPHAAKNAGNQADTIRDYGFAFKSENITGYDAPDGPGTMIWSNTPKHLKDKFAQVFLGEQTYDAALWGREFGYYLKKLEDGTYTTLLRPLKYPDYTGDLFVDFTCIHCGVNTNMAKDQFQKLGDQPKFCRPCLTTVRRSRNIPAKVRCDACGLPKDAFEYDQIMQDYGKKWYCAACRTAVCTDCGKTFTLNPKNIEKRRQGLLRYPRCYDCYKKREENRQWK